MPHGATRDEWTRFAKVGLTPDLLPVVSDPTARISARSSLKGIGKTPSRFNRQREAVGIPEWTSFEATIAEITQWAAEPEYGICVQTRRLRALDVDVDDEPTANAVLDYIRASFGDVAIRYRAGSARLLVPFWLDGDYAKRVMKLPTGGMVEFLATGQQFIAAGEHPSGARYQWRGFDFPKVTPQRFESLWEALAHAFHADEIRHHDKILDANQRSLNAEPSGNVGPTHDPLVEQLKRISLGTGRDGEIYIPCPWKDLHTADSGPSETVYFPAGTGGYVRGHFKCQHAHCLARADADFTLALGLTAGSEGDFENVEHYSDPETPAEASRAKFAVQPVSEFASGPAVDWLVKGVLPTAELAMIYGQSGSGKTFAVLDLCMAVATGREWNSKRVRQGPVIYIAAEAAAGVRRRLSAYARAYGLDLSDVPMGVIPSAPDLTKNDDRDLAAAVQAYGGARLIVLDTLSQSIPGADENSAQDMTRVLLRLKRLAQATNALVLIVHHSGKDQSRGARGFSGIRATIETELEVTHTPRGRLLEIAKQKDETDSAEFYFTLRPVPIGIDEDGDAITSCVCAWSPAPVEAPDPVQQIDGKGRVGNTERIVMDVWAEIGWCDPTLDDIRYAVAKRLAQTGKRDRRLEFADRAIERLQESGALPKNIG